MYEKHHGARMIHARILQNVSQTVLGNGANEREVFFFNYFLGPHMKKTAFKSY
jgi:hypothetical protein